MNQRIYNYSIHLIARQDYSEFKLRRKLLSKPDNTPEEVDEVIKVLKEKKLINEEAYARLFIRKWIFKGEAENKILMRAQAEKLLLTPEQFRRVREELGLIEEETLQSLVHKKMRNKEIPQDYPGKQKLKNQVMRFLISKGYDYSDAKNGIEEFLNNKD